MSDEVGTAIRITENKAVCLGCGKEITSMWEIPMHMWCGKVETDFLEDEIDGATA